MCWILFNMHISSLTCTILDLYASLKIQIFIWATKTVLLDHIIIFRDASIWRRPSMTRSLAHSRSSSWQFRSLWCIFTPVDIEVLMNIQTYIYAWRISPTIFQGRLLFGRLIVLRTLIKATLTSFEALFFLTEVLQTCLLAPDVLGQTWFTRNVVECAWLEASLLFHSHDRVIIRTWLWIVHIMTQLNNS